MSVVEKMPSMKPGDTLGRKKILGLPFRIRDENGHRSVMVVCNDSIDGIGISTIHDVLYPKRMAKASFVDAFGYKQSVRHFNVWREMKRRCYDSKRPKYHRYGGRGIRVCDEWRKSYEAFYEWSVRNGYQPGLQIDRINNDGDYSPENCRWVDCKTNIRNGPGTKLTLVEAVAVHAIKSIGISSFDIAVHLGVNEKTIQALLSGETWRDAGDMWRKLVERIETEELLSSI